MVLRYTAQRAGRLSEILRGELRISYGLMNRLKWQQQLFVNGNQQHTNYPVAAGDVISIPLDDPKPDYPAQEGNLTILYEDEHLLAVDKPAGMLIHPSRNKNTDTLANFVLGYYRQTGQDCAFHPITRLDRDTFGIVLLAKHSHAHALMQKTPLTKTYHALTYGGPREASGIIDAPIARCELPSLLRRISPEGKPSRTEFSLLFRGEAMCLLALTPVTGRTHQLRLHCAHMGFPILGDPQYGSEESQVLSHRLGFFTQQLCAKSLSFPHPLSGQELILSSHLDVPNPY